jgi:hypothetical protein
MYRLTGLIAATVVTLFIPLSLFSQVQQKVKGKTTTGTSDRAHQLEGQATSQHPASCPASGMTLQECHAKFPDGCSASKRPTYDAYLDFLKDQDPGSSAASTKDLGQNDFPALEANLSKLPETLTDKNHAQLANTFATFGEGNIHTVVAYLYFAEDTGAGTTPNSETCNCKLMTAGTFDYHLGIGFDPSLASIAKSHPKESDPSFTKLEKNSVVAEMTPYIRAQHPKWTIARVTALEGQQIKVVGQLIADNEHFNDKDDCAYPRALSGCWRSTIWEIHPITQFYLCKNASGCSASSPASDWTNLDDTP